MYLSPNLSFQAASASQMATGQWPCQAAWKDKLGLRSLSLVSAVMLDVNQIEHQITFK